MTSHLSEPITISAGQIEAIAKQFPGESVLIRQVNIEGDAAESIHVQPKNRLRACWIHKNGNGIGITLESLDKLH